MIGMISASPTKSRSRRLRDLESNRAAHVTCAAQDCAVRETALYEQPATRQLIAVQVAADTTGSAFMLDPRRPLRRAISMLAWRYAAPS
jgi:hypothetical protein